MYVPFPRGGPAAELSLLRRLVLLASYLPGWFAAGSLLALALLGRVLLCCSWP